MARPGKPIIATEEEVAKEAVPIQWYDDPNVKAFLQQTAEKKKTHTSVLLRKIIRSYALTQGVDLDQRH